MKKIYITGIAGLLGSNLAYLLKDKYEIYGCDRNKVLMSGVKASAFDILCENEIEKELVEINPDVVINTVAYVNVDGCEKDSELARRMNAEVPQRIVNISEKTGATVIQISTDAVYKDTNDNLHKEESEVSPVNIYGQTKLNGEKLSLIHISEPTRH